MTASGPAMAPGLADALWRLDADFDRAAAAEKDPVGIARRFSGAEQVVVAHLCAMLAYGSVGLIRRAIEAVLVAVDGAPAAFAADMQPGDFVRRAPDFVYRMTRAEDVDAVLVAMGQARRQFGSLEAAFVDGAGANDADVRPALERYVATLRAASGAVERRGVRYLLADPATGSATKRWHLLLRWLAREDDGADLGCWPRVSTSQLVMPLDTHTSFLVRALGLTDRATVDYRMARQATDALAAICADDPLRFDMPLCHLGIERACMHRYDEAVCGRCGLRGVCRWTAPGGGASA